MVNKQKLWFVTLFSLIIVLSIYYFSSDQSTLSFNNLESESKSAVKNEEYIDDDLSVLNVSKDEAAATKIDELQSVLLDHEATLEEKNNAYDELEVISQNKAKENEISDLIKNEFNYKNFVKISEKDISIVIKNSEHNYDIANSIIRKVQEKFDDNKYISVKFN